MDIEIMCRHYEKTFTNPIDILDWIAHDLQHMGLDRAYIDIQLNKASEYLNAQKRKQK